MDILSPIEMHSEVNRPIVFAPDISDPIPSSEVNHPFHYNAGRIEVIDFIDDQKLDFYQAQIVKYTVRAPHKGKEVQDLEKALWYLEHYIKLKKGLTNELRAD